MLSLSVLSKPLYHIEEYLRILLGGNGDENKVMEIISLLTTSFIVGLTGAMMPGPMLTMTINETSRRGFWAGPVMVAGHSLIELILVIGLMLGLTQLIQQPIVTGTIGLVGGTMLLWMGYGIGRDAAWKKVSFGLTSDSVSPISAPVFSVSPFLAGIITSISNPYWSLWWATVGAGYVVIAITFGPMGILAFYFGHILSDFAWFSAISFIVHTGRNFISDTFYRSILLICSVFLVYLGAYFIYTGLRFLFLN